MALVVAKQSRTFQLLTLAWAARCTRSWEGTQQDSWPQLAKGDMPYYMSCSVYKAGGGGGKKEGGALGVMAFVFPSHRCVW